MSDQSNRNFTLFEPTKTNDPEGNHQSDEEVESNAMVEENVALVSDLIQEQRMSKPEGIFVDTMNSVNEEFEKDLIFERNYAEVRKSNAYMFK